MAAAIRWLDQSASEQKRIQELVKLFQDRESRDELGVGQIRDVFSDVMFPGTSVLQTRAKYFLIVPWLFQCAPSSLSGAGLRGWVEMRERRLIATLQDAGVVEGLVGRNVGPKVKLLASSIYWNGLKRWRVVVGDPDIDQLSGRGVATSEGVDELADRAVGDWAASIPPAPDEFPRDLPGGFELAEDEACWLRDQIVQAVPDSLLSHLVATDQVLSIAEGPWDEPVTWTSADPELLEWIRDAERFSFVVRGAALVYNLLLIEAYRDEGFDAIAADIDHYRDLLESWQAQLDVRRTDIEQWDRGGLRVRVASQNPRIAPTTWAFVNRWVEEALDCPGSLADSRTARALIADRERIKKGRQARLSNKRLLQSWQGESAMRPLTYRWSNIQQIVSDIQRGRGLGDAAA